MSVVHGPVDITGKTILRVMFYLFGAWFLYQIRWIIVTLFVAFVFMTAIRPLAKLAAKIKIPILVVVLLFFLFFLGITTTLVASLVPAVMHETKSLIENLPSYIRALEDRWSITLDQTILTSQFVGIPSNILSIAAGAFGNLTTALGIFFMTYYLILERPYLHKYLVRFFGPNDAEKMAENFIQEVENRVGGWARGQLILMIIIGAMTYVGALLLGIPYALPLAILAGLLEAVPGLGPTIAAIPMVLIGFTISPVTAFGALAMSILIQQLENNLIVPKVMQAATGVRPLVTILVLMIGFTLGGVIGAILSMPVYLVVDTAVTHSYLVKKHNQN